MINTATVPIVRNGVASNIIGGDLGQIDYLNGAYSNTQLLDRLFN